MPGQDWVSKGLVVLKYPKGDFIGLFFGYYSLIVYQIQAVYITLFLRNRDLLTFWCCFTHMISEILNYTIKRILKQPRPDNGAPPGGLFEGKYGMPSQHCHCFAYISTMAFMLTVHYYKRHISRFWKGFVVILFSIGLILQIIGRIYLKFHSVDQCIVGAIFGSTSALTFYFIGIKYFLPHSDKLCSLWPLRHLYFKRDILNRPEKGQFKD